MFNAVMFSSLRLDWQTPKALYDKLDKEFAFDFDPCPHNPEFDGLDIEWGESNFCNPPYGREIGKWIKKGVWEHDRAGKGVVFLIPSRTDTIWWHDYIMKADEIRFVKGRLKFGDSKNSAPFPSAIVIYRQRDDGHT